MSDHEVPLVLQHGPISIIDVDGGGGRLLRDIAEHFNYRCELHLVGSRRQLIEILRGNISTFDFIILDTHGDDDHILIPDEPDISTDELRDIINLPGRTFVNLGCETGGDRFVEAFHQGGCAHYVAPTDSVYGTSNLMFAIHLLYFMGIPNEMDLKQAVEEARQHDAECALFRHFPNPGLSL